MNKNPTNMTQLPDGRWVPAQPLPYYRDVRPVYVKIWHVLLAILTLFRRNRKKHLELLENKIEKKWLVPVEPYTDEDGKWCRW